MGLDMYLYGRKTDFTYIDVRGDEDNVKEEDGFPIAYIELSMGYWRKHSDLHGFIVEEFAKGVDECQRITIEQEGVEQIIEAVKTHQLPSTSGFFFGRSARVGDADLEEQDKQDLEIFGKALDWIKKAERGEHRCLVYHGSW